MARPRKAIKELHDRQRNINLTVDQEALIVCIANYKDIPVQTLMREMLVAELERLTISLGIDSSLLANHPR